MMINNVLVGTDFSECSNAALDYARGIAGQFCARLHVMHVFERFSQFDVGMSGYVGAVPGLQIDYTEAARHDLEALITAEDRRRFRAKTVFRGQGETPAQALVDYATEERIDLIVLGTHGRRGFSHFVMGSVAEKVLRMAPCPVLTVREPDRKGHAIPAVAKEAVGSR